MKKLFFSLLSAGLLLSGCGNDRATTDTTTNTSDQTGTEGTASTDMNTMDTASTAATSTNMPVLTDEQFMMKADEGGHNEIGLSKLALEKGVTGEAKTYANKMVADHTKAGTELMAIAKKKNVKLPGDMDAEHKSIQDRLSKLSGKEFEKAYMDQMVIDHDKTVALFQSEINNGKDADAKAFASKTLPVIQQHTTMAKENDNMKM
ncbi:DUF4142 domain-containing protein [Hymenobacter sp. BT730]|uniref:DUF4142 domain-containing protein n=1 Tax=Hymenobacter sp. BT730 TaxID=3063332 RepID=UPI0026DF7518|nr:DUF4142 domain-containing protein [Hymenobacter sp. BT730]